MTERPIMFQGPMIRAIVACTKTETRRLVKNLRVRLPGTVTADMMPHERKPSVVARPGVYPARMNRQGAVFITTPQGELGVKPGEFDFVCPYFKGETQLADVGGGVKRWILTGSEPQRLWVKERWRTHERPEDSVDGVLFEADNAFVKIENTREAADRWIEAHDNGKHGENWRSPLFMPRWASRLVLEPYRVVLEPITDLDEDAARREGVEELACSYYSFDYQDHIRRRVPGVAVQVFADHWKAMHGDISWREDVWVWVIRFAKTDK